MKFVKMHSCGNDYVYTYSPTLDTQKMQTLAQSISNRRKGVGSDGLISIFHGDQNCDVKMAIFNTDGSEGNTCGNGVRCVAKFAYERLGLIKNPITVNTKAGNAVVSLNILDGKVISAKVNMGKPKILPLSEKQLNQLQNMGVYVDYRNVFVIDVGNLHLVSFEKNHYLNLIEFSEKIDKSRAFNGGINVEVAKVFDDTIQARVFERGSGLTSSCGSGTVAIAYAAKKANLIDSQKFKDGLKIYMPGGPLSVSFEDENAILSGETVEVFSGDYYE